MPADRNDVDRDGIARNVQEGVLNRAAIKAGFVFAFMAFLAVQAGTGFMRDLFAGMAYPRAMRAVDWMLETVVIGPLGQIGGAIALLVLGFVFAVLVWRQAARERAA